MHKGSRTDLGLPRKNQGSSGKVYPYPVTEKISYEKTDHVYRAVFLENQYLKVMVLPDPVSARR